MKKNNCGEPCDLLEPEQTEPEPTQKLGWEEEFDGMELGDGLCPLCAGLASIGSDTSENCQDCKTPTTREELNAFIRKVEKEAYERGLDDGKRKASDTIMGFPVEYFAQLKKDQKASEALTKKFNQ